MYGVSRPTTTRPIRAARRLALLEAPARCLSRPPTQNFQPLRMVGKKSASYLARSLSSCPVSAMFHANTTEMVTGASASWLSDTWGPGKGEGESACASAPCSKPATPTQARRWRHLAEREPVTQTRCPGKAAKGALPPLALPTTPPCAAQQESLSACRRHQCRRHRRALHRAARAQAATGMQGRRAHLSQEVGKRPAGEGSVQGAVPEELQGSKGLGPPGGWAVAARTCQPCPPSDEVGPCGAAPGRVRRRGGQRSPCGRRERHHTRRCLPARKARAELQPEGEYGC